MVTRIRKGTPATATEGLSTLQSVAGALGLEGERMSKVDTAWLRMDSATNLMMIVGVWILRPASRARRWRSGCRTSCWLPALPPDRAAGRSGRPLARRPRLFARPPCGDAHAAPPPRPGRPGQALQARAGELAMRPLDPAHPLWQFELIEHYEGGSALIARIHHCIADGIALISVMMSLVDGGTEPPKRSPQAPKPGLEAAEDWVADTLIRPFGDIAARALDAAGGGAAKSLSMLLAPQQGLGETLDQALEVARLGGQLASDLAALALMPDDSPTRLKGQPVGQKRVAWCEPIPLAEVKAIGKALNCSVNDVLLSCVAGAIAGYLRRHGDDPAGRKSGPWCRSTCGRWNRPGSWATASASCRWCCRWALPTRSSACTRCARA
jgi:diacylglycerol O-acyltransferase / wax synthase